MRDELRIATYNVNSINARLPVLLRWLSETQPDIACLQELKAPNARLRLAATPSFQFPDQGFRLPFVHQTFAHV